MDKQPTRDLGGLLDSVRKIDGFPIAEVKDILELSVPPFYTACPNPYLDRFVEKNGSIYDENEPYQKSPFSYDVSEGKGGGLYNVHTYHTKVPPKAIMKFIKHYTKPGDIVFDGFCGTGMTGVAAQLCKRNAILSDLSPIATFIAYNYNINTKYKEFIENAELILNDFKKELSWLYETSRSTKEIFPNKKKPTVNFIVWVDVFICPYCGEEYNFCKNTTISNESKILEKNVQCPKCNAEIYNKKRAYQPYYDNVQKKNILLPKKVPILKNEKKSLSAIDNTDLDLIKKINNMEIPYWFPINKLPYGVNTNTLIKRGYTHLYHLYTKRNLWSTAYIYDRIKNVEDKELRNLLLFWFTSVGVGQTILNRYFENSYSQVNRYSKGMLNVGKKMTEVNPCYSHKNKIKVIAKNLDYLKTNVIIGTNSSTNIPIKENSVDYIFTDPPFGKNIMYSELNFIWESWLKIFTNIKSEAIINKIQDKNLQTYKVLMIKSFKEFYRILKPNHWITIVFHNSKASVWNAIQESINKAGFIIAQVTTLDKKQKTFIQMTTAGSTKNDLIINAYKPEELFAKGFIKNAGKNMEIDFVKQQLLHLPINPDIERTEKMLYSKMLAHYIENGFKINYNSTNLSTLLSDNFYELDGYWFLESQIKEYNIWKSKLNLDQLKSIKDGQQVLMIIDEKSALIWLYYFLNTPKEYSKIYTAYQQVASISKDKVPEIKALLENNFLFKGGKYQRPTNEKERKVVEENSTRDLIRAFNRIVKIVNEEGRKIKNVRIEGLIYGFTKLYQQGKYKEILEIADQLSSSMLESNIDIMDFVNIARIKTETQEDLL